MLPSIRNETRRNSEHYVNMFSSRVVYVNAIWWRKSMDDSFDDPYPDDNAARRKAEDRSKSTAEGTTEGTTEGTADINQVGSIGQLSSTAAASILADTDRHRYPPSKIREAMLAEPWQTVDAFFDPDTPEAHELMSLLTSFEVKIANVDPMVIAADELDPALANFSNATGSSTSSPDEPQDLVKRVKGGALVPKIRFSPEFDSYIDKLCNANSNVGASHDDPGDNTSGPLSFLSLSRLSIDQQVLRIMQHRHAETTERIRALITHVAVEELAGYHKNSETAKWPVP